jgi:hypothetical protein
MLFVFAVKYWACQIHYTASTHVCLRIMFMLLFLICQFLQSVFILRIVEKIIVHFSPHHAALCPANLSFLDFSINNVKSPIIFQTCQKETRVLAYAIHVHNTASENIELKRSTWKRTTSVRETGIIWTVRTAIRCDNSKGALSKKASVQIDNLKSPEAYIQKGAFAFSFTGAIKLICFCVSPQFDGKWQCVKKCTKFKVLMKV